ncbi:hypothetical protein GCM10007103_07350 [Salinimicrobium marinum]|uniref:DUF4920 domain-containing protein n=1 Tax=Salinimicrobium marinum TaxID=680283 RepID=A0A918S9Z4_9FLAO|nr:DUF4920 domain-containing protein [Salinimicrobium marinum]GHA28298.1 hypothetical protein GCM10007103_07350 [Salinimicrobium marinum]
MKKILIFVFVAMAFSSCKNRTENQEKSVVQTTEDFPVSYISAGEEFSPGDILSSAEMQQKFQELKAGDTVEVKFKSQVNTVCKSKGCWMKLDLPNEEEVMVKFKDYGFFVPKDIEEKEVVVNGKAYVTEMSVEDQQHFAEDGGKSPEEIAAITEPKKTLSFLAEGVVIEDN